MHCCCPDRKLIHMEIAERNLKYKCSDSIHILRSIVRNLAGIFVNHQRACWFRDSSLASSNLDVISSHTGYYSELSLQNTFCCYPCAMQAHLSYFYPWKHLGAGGIHFFAVQAVSQAEKQKSQPARQTLRLWALWSTTGMCRLRHRGLQPDWFLRTISNRNVY